MVKTDTFLRWNRARPRPAADVGLYQQEVADLIGVSLGFAPYTPMQSFPDWLKTLRTATGLTQEQLAQELAVDESTVVKWEKGRTGQLKSPCGGFERSSPIVRRTGLKILGALGPCGFDSHPGHHT